MFLVDRHRNGQGDEGREVCVNPFHYRIRASYSAPFRFQGGIDRTCLDRRGHMTSSSAQIEKNIKKNCFLSLQRRAEALFPAQSSTTIRAGFMHSACPMPRLLSTNLSTRFLKASISSRPKAASKVEFLTPLHYRCIKFISLQPQSPKRILLTFARPSNVRSTFLVLPPVSQIDLN